MKPEIDFNSRTWAQLRQWTQVRLNEYREDNDRITLSEIDTAHLQGRIQEVKELLELEESPPEMPTFTENENFMFTEPDDETN